MKNPKVLDKGKIIEYAVWDRNYFYVKTVDTYPLIEPVKFKIQYNYGHKYVKLENADYFFDIDEVVNYSIDSSSLSNLYAKFDSCCSIDKVFHQARIIYFVNEKGGIEYFGLSNYNKDSKFDAVVLNALKDIQVHFKPIQINGETRCFIFYLNLNPYSKK